MIPLSINFEKTVVAYLKTSRTAYGMGSIQVRTLRPAPNEPRPAEWLRVIVGASTGRTNIVTDTVNVILEGYTTADGDGRAFDIVNWARTALFNADGVLFGAREITGPFRFPDPLIPEQVRYTATLAVRARAAPTA